MRVHPDGELLEPDEEVREVRSSAERLEGYRVSYAQVNTDRTIQATGEGDPDDDEQGQEVIQSDSLDHATSWGMVCRPPKSTEGIVVVVRGNDVAVAERYDPPSALLGTPLFDADGEVALAYGECGFFSEDGAYVFIGNNEMRIENSTGDKIYSHKDGALPAARKTDPVHNGTAGKFDAWGDSVDAAIAALRSGLASTVTWAGLVHANLYGAGPPPASPPGYTPTTNPDWTAGDTIGEIKSGSDHMEIG